MTQAVAEYSDSVLFNDKDRATLLSIDIDNKTSQSYSYNRDRRVEDMQVVHAIYVDFDSDINTIGDYVISKDERAIIVTLVNNAREFLGNKEFSHIRELLICNVNRCILRVTNISEGAKENEQFTIKLESILLQQSSFRNNTPNTYGIMCKLYDCGRWCLDKFME